MEVKRHIEPGKKLYDLKAGCCFCDDNEVWMKTDLSFQPSPVTWNVMHNQILAVSMRNGSFRVYDASDCKVYFPCYLQEERP